MARLAGAAPIAALVGQAVDWFDRPRGTFPALVLTKISPGREWTHGGPDGLDEPRVQFDAYALTKAQAAALARAAIAEMQVARTHGGTRFHEAFLEGERWLPAGDVEGLGPLFRVQFDFLFFFEEV